MKAVELFTGAGGLAIALTKAGVIHKALVELDKDSCNTLRQNIKYLQKNNEDIEIFEGDARVFDYSKIKDTIDIVAGGPPCQPFSLGGKHKGYNDKRDMFPEAVRAIKFLRPKAFIFENVKGLTRSVFHDYFEYIILQLTYPSVEKKNNENWIQHKLRLINQQERVDSESLKYSVSYKVLNAADYGVPQKRERVFFVGFRHDLDVKWSFPVATHSQEALLRSKWITKTYWEKFKINPIPNNMISKETISILSSDLFIDDKLPWKTIRDVICDLPDPVSKNSIANHEYRGGAKQYAGHTGSNIDEPSKTIKAGVHGVPGGENAIIFPDGSGRYLTTREAARIQTFPDEYIFSSSWTESMRQIGNAVPVLLGETVVKSVVRALEKNEQTNSLQSA